MVTEAKTNDISVDDGKLIVAEAASWKGTPYKLNGPGAIREWVRIALARPKRSMPLPSVLHVSNSS
jgi:hypothetical protein